VEQQEPQSQVQRQAAGPGPARGGGLMAGLFPRRMMSPLAPLRMAPLGGRRGGPHLITRFLFQLTCLCAHSASVYPYTCCILLPGLHSFTISAQLPAVSSLKPLSFGTRRSRCAAAVEEGPGLSLMSPLADIDYELSRMMNGESNHVATLPSRTFLVKLDLTGCS